MSRRNKGWRPQEQRQVEAALLAGQEQSAAEEEMRQKMLEAMDLRVRHIAGPNAISHVTVGPDPQRHGKPTAFVIGGLDYVMTLARDLYVKHHERGDLSMLSPEAAWNAANEFFERAFMAAYEHHVAEMEKRKAEAPVEPPTENKSEGGIILP